MPMTYREFKCTDEYRNALDIDVYGINDVKFHPEVPEEWIDNQLVHSWNTDGDKLSVKLFEPYLHHEDNPVPCLNIRQINRLNGIEKAAMQLIDALLADDEHHFIDIIEAHEIAFAAAKALADKGVHVSLPRRVWDKDAVASIVEDVESSYADAKPYCENYYNSDGKLIKSIQSGYYCSKCGCSNIDNYCAECGSRIIYDSAQS